MGVDALGRRNGMTSDFQYPSFSTLDYTDSIELHTVNIRMPVAFLIFFYMYI